MRPSWPLLIAALLGGCSLAHAAQFREPTSRPTVEALETEVARLRAEIALKNEHIKAMEQGFDLMLRTVQHSQRQLAEASMLVVKCAQTAYSPVSLFRSVQEMPAPILYEARNLQGTIFKRVTHRLTLGMSPARVAMTMKGEDFKRTESRTIGIVTRECYARVLPDGEVFMIVEYKADALVDWLPLLFWDIPTTRPAARHRN